MRKKQKLNLERATKPVWPDAEIELPLDRVTRSEALFRFPWSEANGFGVQLTIDRESWDRLGGPRFLSVYLSTTGGCG